MFIGIIIGILLSSTFFLLFIKYKEKNVVPEKYSRRGIYKKIFSVSGSFSTKVTIEATYEIGELESTDVLSKVEVIEVKTDNSEYNSDYYKKKLTEMIDRSWLNQSDIQWINKISDIRNKKIDKILN